MSRARLRVVSVSTAGLVLLLACGKSGVEPAGEATLFLSADVSGTSVATVVVDVTAPDIPTALVFNLPVANGTAAGAIVVPAGSQRTIAMRAYDAGGVKTHSGSVVLNVQPGANPTITLVMQPLTGDIPITVTLGSVSITVTPPTLTLAVGATAPLAASITDWNGSPIVGSVRWATNNPGIAAVDETGVVTAVGVGSTQVVATFQGAGGQAAVSVTP